MLLYIINIKPSRLNIFLKKVPKTSKAFKATGIGQIVKTNPIKNAIASRRFLSKIFTLRFLL
jgi:hypothetical protein